MDVLILPLIETAGEATKVFQTIGRIIVAGSEAGGKALPLPFPLPLKIEARPKTKIATKQDGQKVLKVSSAIDCVEEALTQPGIVAAIFKSVLAQATNNTFGTLLESDAVAILAKPLADCFRKKALGQDSTRRSVLQRHRSRKGWAGARGPRANKP